MKKFKIKTINHNSDIDIFYIEANNINDAMYEFYMTYNGYLILEIKETEGEE